MTTRRRRYVDESATFWNYFFPYEDEPERRRPRYEDEQERRPRHEDEPVRRRPTREEEPVRRRKPSHQKRPRRRATDLYDRTLTNYGKDALTATGAASLFGGAILYANPELRQKIGEKLMQGASMQGVKQSPSFQTAMRKNTNRGGQNEVQSNPVQKRAKGRT